MASGLAVVYLPYADDIRNPPVEGGPKVGVHFRFGAFDSVPFNSCLQANDEQRKAAKAIVKKLQIKFGSEEFQNPGENRNEQEHDGHLCRNLNTAQQHYRSTMPGSKQ